MPGSGRKFCADAQPDQRRLGRTYKRNTPSQPATQKATPPAKKKKELSYDDQISPVQLSDVQLRTTILGVFVRAFDRDPTNASAIAGLLGCDLRTVRSVIDKYDKAELKNENLTDLSATEVQGRPPRIQLGTETADTAAAMLMKGAGLRMAAGLTSEKALDGRGTIGKSVVHRFKERTNARTTKTPKRPLGCPCLNWVVICPQVYKTKRTAQWGQWGVPIGPLWGCM